MAQQTIQNIIIPKRPSVKRKPNKIQSAFTPKPAYEVEHENEHEMTHDRLLSLFNFEQYAIDQSHLLISREQEFKTLTAKEQDINAKKEQRLQCYKNKLEQLKDRLKQQQNEMIKHFKNKLGAQKTMTFEQVPQRSYKPKVYKQYGEMIQLKGKVLDSEPISFKKMKCHQNTNTCDKVTTCIKPVKVEINVSPFKSNAVDILSDRLVQCPPAAEGGRKRHKM